MTSNEITSLPEGMPTLRVMPMPSDANVHGDVFGGWIMAQVDIAGALPAVRRANGRVGTVAVNSFVFKQPVFVGDVAQAFVDALDEVSGAGQVYELVGPHVYTLRQLVQLAGACSGHPRAVIGLPEALARLQAWFLEHVPGGPLMSRDNLDSMKVNNIASPHGLGLRALGISEPKSIKRLFVPGH